MIKLEWNSKTRSRVTDCAIAIYLLAIYYSIFDIHFAFDNTHVSGGDMISHPAIANTMKQLWSHGHFWGWSSAWFGGYPFLYFYFYPIYAMDLILQFFSVPEAIAFKLVVLFVVSLVPVGHYFFSRRWLSRPVSFLVAALGTAIFMNEADSIGGGSFKSVMAGQVSHQLGLMCVVAFFSYLAKRQHKSRGAIVTLALSILCHVYSALFAAALACVYVAALAIEKKSLKAALKDTKRWWLGISVCSFFWLPFIWYHRWTVIPINHTQVTWQALINTLRINDSLYVTLYAVALIGILILCIFKKIKVFHLLLFFFCLLIILFIPYSQGTPVLHVRLLAEIYLTALFLCALTFQALDEKLSTYYRAWILRWAVFGFSGFVVLQSFVPSSLFDRDLPPFLRHGVKEVPGWWAWNMSGIEAKPQSVDVLQVWNFMKNMRDVEGRYAVEYNDYGAYGSPRIFELTPAITGKPIMEGLLLESSATYPVYYYSMLESNPTTWWPGFTLKVPPINPLNTIRHLGLYNVRHFIASRPETKAALKAANLQPSFENGEFAMFDVNTNSRIANRIDGEIPTVTSAHPLMLTVEHMPESLDVLNEVVFKKGKEFDGPLIASKQIVTPLDSEWSEDGQTLKVAVTGASEAQPKSILFKIPYFPNWRTSTGEDVRLATGNLMLVSTKSPTISLQYRPGWIEFLSGWVSILSLIILVGLDLPPFESLIFKYVVQPFRYLENKVGRH